MSTLDEPSVEKTSTSDEMGTLPASVDDIVAQVEDKSGRGGNDEIQIVPMGFYPDNAERERRVNQLITQTTTLQSQFVDAEDAIKDLTDIKKSAFDNIAKYHGFSTVEEYIRMGQTYLSPAQQANYKHMCEQLIAHNPHIERTYLAFGIIGGVGTFLKIVPTTVVNVVCKFGAFLHGMQGLLRGLVMIVKGAFEDGFAILRTFSTLLKANWSRKLVSGTGPGVDIANKTARNLRWLRRAGKVLLWVGIIAEAILLIVDYVKGKHDREMLRLAIIECCSSRFGTKKIQLLLTKVNVWVARSMGFINSMNDLIEKKNDPDCDPDLKPTDAQIRKSALRDLDKMAQDFEKGLQECNSDEKVVDALNMLDGRDAQGAWKNEDPTTEEIKKWIQDHPPKDKNGNIVRIDEPLSGNTGLKWSTTSVAADNKVSVRITATNVEKYAQYFTFIHVSIPIVTSPNSSPLFVSNNFKVKGAPDAATGDGLMSVEVSGVHDYGNLSINANDKSWLEFQVNTGKDYVAPIQIDANGTLTVILEGKTTGAGKSALLLTEKWWPRASSDKVWSDLEVTRT